MKKKDNYVILFIICLFLIGVVGLLYTYSDDNKDNSINTSLLKDYNRFFTIDNCINKYISYLADGDKDKILKVLNSDYVSDNNIASSNLFDYIEQLDGSYSFSTREIRYEDVSSNNIRYYVEGILSENILDGNDDGVVKYYIVNFYLDNDVFDIMPYDGGIFNENN